MTSSKASKIANFVKIWSVNYVVYFTDQTKIFYQNNSLVKTNMWTKYEVLATSITVFMANLFFFSLYGILSYFGILWSQNSHKKQNIPLNTNFLVFCIVSDNNKMLQSMWRSEWPLCMPSTVKKSNFV